MSLLSELDWGALQAAADAPEPMSFMMGRAQARKLVEVLEAAERKIQASEADNARLRALVKAAWRPGVWSKEAGPAEPCPWCGSGAEHNDDCPAFTPEGEVR